MAAVAIPALHPRLHAQIPCVFLLDGNTVTRSDAFGIRAFRDSLKQNQSLVRSFVLHAGQSRPLDTDILALPWGRMVAGG